MKKNWYFKINIFLLKRFLKIYFKEKIFDVGSMVWDVGKNGE